MKDLLRIACAMLLLAGQVAADPMKCVIAGKTVYSDDPGRCANGTLIPIEGSITIMPIPKQAGAKTAAQPTLPDLPSWLNNIMSLDDMPKEDIAKGWQTIMDARKRGAWQAPASPDDEQ